MLLGFLAFLVAASERGDLERRVVIRVDAHRQKADRLVRPVLDLDPDRLYALFIKRNTKKFTRLLLVGYRRGHPDIILDLRDGALFERHGLDGCEIETRGAAGQA